MQQPEHARTPRRKRISLIIGLLVIVGLIIFALRSYWLSAPAEPVTSNHPLDIPIEEPELNSMSDVSNLMEGKPVPPELAGMKLPPFDEDDHIRGNRFADFSIVEYSNFGNSYAALLHPELTTYVASHSGAVNWVYRHYPMATAQYLPAQAAECAYFQKGHDGFWAFFDAGFSQKNQTKQSLINLATSQGLDTTSFTTCLEQNFTYDHVLIDLQDGLLDAKVTVSPSYVVVNNLTGKMRLVEGINTIAYLQQVLDAVK